MNTTRSTTPPDLDGFTFVEWLGGGGFADVFRYRETSLAREVAVKVLHRGLGGSALDAFHAEATLMARLSNHPSIVSIHRAGVAADGRPYLVMEMCPASHLGARIARRTFSLQRTLELGIQICGAVHTAHEHKILHRDIKPANILFTEFGRPALTDFGISVSSDTALQSAGRALSPPWAPPEQFGNSPHPMGPWSDVYALGATLWAMLGGRSPMELPGGTGDSMSLADRVRRMPPPRTGRDDVPDSVERCLAVALAKDPGHRYQSALEFARALQTIQVECHLSVTPLDVLSEDADDDRSGGDTGTKVVGIQLIDPDGPGDLPVGTGTVGGQTWSSPGRTAPRRETNTSDHASLSAAGSLPVLQHGRGVAPAIEPRSFTGHAPVEIEHVNTYVPEPLPAGPAASGRSSTRRPVVAAALAALVIAAGGGLALTRLGDSLASSPTAQAADPADPIGNVVPLVQDLAGSRSGSRVTFTWTNPDPQPGDAYSYWVEELGAERVTQQVNTATVTVPVHQPKTCIEIQLRRANGRTSGPQTRCVE